MPEKHIYFLIALVFTVVSIGSYHFFVTLPILDILESVQVSQSTSLGSGAQIAKSGNKSEDGSGEIVKEEEDVSWGAVIFEVSVPAFEIPHNIYSAGEQKEILVSAKILRVSKYVIVDSSAYSSVDLPICVGGVCGGEAQEWPLNRAQALVSIDIEFTNKNRVGSIAIDPVKQIRLSNEDNFFVAKIAGTENETYAEIPELAATTKTIVTYIPKDLDQLNFIYGVDINNPSGLFRIDFDSGRVDALVG